MSSDDRSTLNPAGAARRRLSRAAGLGAVAASVSLDWRKPVISLGGLPAHAQASRVGCPVDLAFTVSGSPEGAYSVTVTAGASILGATSWVGSQSHPFSTAYFQGTSQTVAAGIDYSIGAGTLFMSGAATCCTGQNFNSNSRTDPSGSLTFVVPTTLDDGNCFVDD